MEIIRKYHGENILVETAEGKRVVVPESWTDHGTELENEAAINEAPHLLDYEGLVQVAELIDRIKRKGETQTTCQTEAEDYDGGQRKEERTSEAKS
ncbi:MAG: hypothetical protein H8E29_16180 [Anaerolineales bacterium]|uniref:Uncharacterized protein n=1 Tax=Candidatus Desulfolinea nitratireducens TaxID=2841698 RepID=A0A8J6NJD2_9CHLR|nr:hypothetical protein [Candidatus Desulfolinea nitratireducens]